MKKQQQNISVRPATMEDLPFLQRWDEDPGVIQADPESDWDWELELTRTPSWREQLVAEIDGRPIGFIQIIDPHKEETHYWGDVPAGLRAIDIWIGEKADRGKGFGTTMMRLAIERCFAHADVKGILIDPLESNYRAHRFYELLGFHFVENRWFEKDYCRVYRLDR